MNELTETLYLVRLFIYVELGLTLITAICFLWWFIRRNWRRFKMRTFGKSRVDELFDEVFETVGEQRQRLCTLEETVFQMTRKRKTK